MKKEALVVVMLLLVARSGVRLVAMVEVVGIVPLPKEKREEDKRK